MNTMGSSPPDAGPDTRTDWADEAASRTSHDRTAAPPQRGTRLAHMPRYSRNQNNSSMFYVVTDEVPRQEATHKPFIVPCPACAGTGRVLGDGSQVRVACRLCWERCVVARIVADQYLLCRQLAGSGVEDRI